MNKFILTYINNQELERKKEKLEFKWRVINNVHTKQYYC